MHKSFRIVLRLVEGIRPDHCQKLDYNLMQEKENMMKEKTHEAFIRSDDGYSKCAENI